MAGVRSIELTGGAIAIDGTPVSGAELTAKLGADADPVVRLSYLTDADRRALFGATAGADRPAPAPSPPPVVDRRRGDDDRRRGDRIRFGGSITVAEDEVVDGNVVALGGAAEVNGQVLGDVVAFGGGVVLGPKADVSGDVVSFGGDFQRAPGSRVGGEVRFGGFDAENWWSRIWERMGPRWPFVAPLALVAQVARIAVLCLLAALILLVGRGYVERIGDRAATEPLKAGAVGLLAQILFLPLLIVTIVLLVVTIIGIPLLVLVPFAILGLVLVALVGFTSVAHEVGRLLTRSASGSTGPYMTTVIGIVALLAPVLIARLVMLVGGLMLSPIAVALTLVGWLIEYLAWTVGFGAVAVMYLREESDSGGDSELNGCQQKRGRGKNPPDPFLLSADPCFATGSYAAEPSARPVSPPYLRRRSPDGCRPSCR